MHNRWIGRTGILLIPLFMMLLSGCDWTYKIQPPGKQLDELRLVSTYPAYIDNGTMVPVCFPANSTFKNGDPMAGNYKDKAPNGFIINFVMTSTGEDKTTEDPFIFPGEVVKQVGVTHTGSSDIEGKLLYVDQSTNVGTSSFDINLDCLDSIHSNSINTQCNGLKKPPINHTMVDFHSYFSCIEPDQDKGQLLRICPHHKAKNEVGVIVMFDNSGSMEGWVDPVTKQEVGKTGGSLNQNELRATDNNWNARAQAWNAFKKTLNPHYKRMILRFGELAGNSDDKLILTGCENPDGLPEADLWNRCFGVNTQANKIEILKKTQNITKGRTPLWYAVKRVYEYLRDYPGLKDKHIIVVDDSPDTCNPKSPYYNWNLDTACSSVGYDEFKQEFLDDLAKFRADPKNNPDPTQIHISFIQIQSLGYLERDPQQMETACMTRGHYIFLNARDWGDSLDKYNDHLAKALREAMTTLAYSLQGFWQYGFDLVDLNNGTSKVTPGTYAVVSGKLTLKGGKPDSLAGKLKIKHKDGSVTYTDIDTVMPFIVGNSSNSNNQVSSLKDNRLVMRIPCGNGAKCTNSNDEYPCAKGCKDDSDQTVNYLDPKCVNTQTCVETLGLCHWEYKGEDADCGNGKCTLGECQQEEGN